jgi:spermidine/putrescine transport system substrate-binding protein
MSNLISRRSFNRLLGTSTAIGVAAGMMPKSAFAGDTITVLNWQGYGTDEAWALKAFAEKTGIAVKHDYFNAEAEMLTKMQTNPGAYDVVLSNSARVRQLTAPHLIDPIDFSKIPNSKDLSPSLKDHANLTVDGKAYGCAWVWGMTGLAARKGKVAPGVSIAVLADPAFANRVAMDDDPIIAIGIGALMSGQSINAPKDLQLVGDKLKSMKKNVRLLWSSEDEWNKAFAADQFDLSVFWSGGAIRSLRRSKLPVEFIVPKEGAIGWLDCLTVPSSSSKKDAAYAFINYMIDPTFYDEWATKAGAPASANTVAVERLPSDDLNRVTYKPEYLTTMQFNAPLSDEVRSSFVELWTQVKAYYAS